MTGKVRTQEERDIFFRFYIFLKMKIKKISEYLNLSISTCYKWLHEGQKKPTRPTKNYYIRHCLHTDIISYIIQNNTLTLKDITSYIDEKYKITVSISTVFRFCKLNKLTYKKGTKLYAEINLQLVKKFIDEIKNINLNDIHILDEASFVMNHVQAYARSVKGTRAIVIRPGNRGKRYSLIMCISNNGVSSCELHSQSIDSIKFRSFIETLPNNIILVLDNASIHHATNSLIKQNLNTISELCKNKNIKLVYLPAYTPQLNPVEYCFNIIRTFVNKNRPRTFDSLVEILDNSIDRISANTCKSIIQKVWFTDCKKFGLEI
jgi:transposase